MRYWLLLMFIGWWIYFTLFLVIWFTSTYSLIHIYIHNIKWPVNFRGRKVPNLLVASSLITSTRRSGDWLVGPPGLQLVLVNARSVDKKATSIHNLVVMNGQICHVSLCRGRKEWPWGTCLFLWVVVWWSGCGKYYHLPFFEAEHFLIRIQLLPISSTRPSPFRESVSDASWIHLVSSMHLGSFLIILKTWFTADLRQHLGSLTKSLLNGLSLLANPSLPLVLWWLQELKWQKHHWKTDWIWLCLDMSPSSDLFCGDKTTEM